jgi:hypothetical protein
MSDDEWANEQLKPLSMFDLAKWWADAVKVIGAGNGVGLLAAGFALGPTQGHHPSFLLMKLAGTFFFIGVFAFVAAFGNLHRAMFAQDEVAQATLRKDVAAINRNSAISGTAMIFANKCAYAAIAAFLIGCVIGLVGFLLF